MTNTKTVFDILMPQPEHFRIIVRRRGEVIYSAPYIIGERHDFPNGLPSGHWEVSIKAVGRPVVTEAPS